MKTRPTMPIPHASIAFSIPGTPVPKERPRVFHGRTITAPRTFAYEALARDCCRKAIGEARRAGVVWPTSDGVTFAVTIVIQCGDKKRRDLDNIAKAILDAFNRVAWVDDEQVGDLRVIRGPVSKEHPRALVMIETIDRAAHLPALAALIASIDAVTLRPYA